MLKITNTKSFTLMEMIITIIIAMILLFVAVPAMRTIIGRAVLQESIANMTTIGVSEKLFFIRHRHFGDLVELNAERAFGPAGLDELDGQYFDDDCYNILLIGNSFRIECDTGLSTSPLARSTLPANLHLFMDPNGSVFSDPPFGGYNLPPN